jgi:hypothetical protein
VSGHYVNYIFSTGRLTRRGENQRRIDALLQTFLKWLDISSVSLFTYVNVR